MIATSGTPLASQGLGARQGYLYQPEVGLYYVRQRWLDPITRQWLSPDPMGLAAGDYNLYRYVGNRAPDREDPSGMGEGFELSPREQAISRWKLNGDAANNIKSIYLNK